jgi:DnaK suppressor protein
MDEQPDARAMLLAERQAAIDRLSALDRDFAGIVEATGSANADDEHDPEGATIAFERQHVAALIDQTRDQLSELDGALRRLDEGSYGRCVQCGRPIGTARLAARPVAQTCISCASGQRGRQRAR